jgi:hypothetical protein
MGKEPLVVYYKILVPMGCLQGQENYENRSVAEIWVQQSFSTFSNSWQAE